MAKSGINLKIEGFEELLNAIQAAGGSIDQATDSALKQSAQIVQAELKTQMQQANVPADLINAMPAPEIITDGSTHIARVGYKKGEFNVKSLSDGYKVVLLNYGTPHRSKHGKMTAKGFIQLAKKKAAPKVRKVQKEVFNKILGRLQK